MSWICPHQEEDHCNRLKKKCEVGQKGCVLDGKISFIEIEDSGLNSKKEAKKEE